MSVCIKICLEWKYLIKYYLFDKVNIYYIGCIYYIYKINCNLKKRKIK